MKIGSIDILKAYLGALELVSSNAFIGSIPIIDNPTPIEYAGLKMTSTGNSTVALSQAGKAPTVDLKYSLDDGNTWTHWDYSEISLSDGDSVCFKGLNTAFATNQNIYNYFVMTGSIAASGNIMSIIDDGACNTTTIPANYCFLRLFYGCTSLTTAPTLPATTLAPYCYQSIFNGCTSLSTAPTLPATTLAEGCYREMFQNCTSLTTAPTLPATTLAPNCYRSMFYDCTGLTTATTLPATTLATNCYQYMFRGCTSLSTAPTLPATTLAENCYYGMFHTCTSLTATPALPATTLATNCYQYMFHTCTSLTAAPALPATTLAPYCYQNIFNGCTALVTAPALPATTLAEGCYREMFQNCTSLTTAPELLAPRLVLGCYRKMFNGCTNLNYIKCLATDISASNCTNSWVSGVAAIGTFVKNSSMTRWTTGTSGIPTNWTVDEYYDVLKFTSTGNSSVALHKQTSQPADVKYSLDNGSTWTQWDYSAISLTDGQTVCFKGNNPSGWNKDDWSDGNYFIMTGSIAASGNIMSLIDDGACITTTIPCNQCFRLLFYRCTSLTTAPEFPATNATESCYENAFYGCTSLTAAPELPATTLGNWCYTHMFRNCTSLTSVPSVLPATTLSSGPYYEMFGGCTSLTTVPINLLPATDLSNPLISDSKEAYKYMFYGCTSLTNAPNLPATTLVPECYWSMFSGCTSLTTAPVLPATTLTEGCYQGMFNNCTNLNYIKCLATNISASNCTTGWVTNVAATGTFVKYFYNRDWTTGVSGIPSGWTVETEGEFEGLKFTSTGNSTVALAQVQNPPAVDLKYSLDDGETWVQWDFSAISLSDGDSVCFKGLNTTFATDSDNYNRFVMTGSIAASGNIMSIIDNGACTTTTIPANYCFNYLFYACHSLTSAPELPATTLATACYQGMFTMCKLLTTATALPATTLTTYCYNGMFSSCISLTTAPALPATKLKQYCYQYMFNGCKSLTTAPALPATTLTDWCYSNMFSSCTSLTTAPVLPALKLVNRCYNNMFNGCTNLNYIKCLATNISASSCTQYWVSDVAASGTFVKKSSMTKWSTGTSGIPSGWTVQDAA